MLPVNFECPVDVVKAYEEEGRWIVEGYAATSDFDLQDDIISEEAIRASAKDLLENSTVLHNHKPDEAIGRVLASRARKAGLFLKILISKTASDIWQQVTEEWSQMAVISLEARTAGGADPPGAFLPVRAVARAQTGGRVRGGRVPRQGRREGPDCSTAFEARRLIEPPASQDPRISWAVPQARPGTPAPMDGWPHAGDGALRLRQISSQER